MKVAITSAFRNAVDYIPRYFEQMNKLKDALALGGHELSLVLAYGDSQDKTSETLKKHVSGLEAKLVEVSHGGRDYGSVVNTNRFRQLAKVGNALWEALPDDADVVGLVESDLLWKPEALLGLLDGLGETEIRSPMVYHLDGRFYDTWAFRFDSTHFINKKPHHACLALGSRYVTLESVGSVFFAPAHLAKQLSWPTEDVVVGLCRQARMLGATIHVDTTLGVYHP